MEDPSSAITTYLETDREERLTGEPMLRVLRAFRDSPFGQQSDAPGEDVNEQHRELVRQAGGELTKQDELAVATVTFDQLMLMCVKMLAEGDDTGTDVFLFPLLYGIAAAWRFMDDAVSA